jgi:replication factor C subunit 2/4
VLDEADSLTTDAQTALRRIIEVSSKGTRFCIICNYVSRIIDPLTSRCAKFRFKPVNLTDGLAKLEHICEAEDVKFVGGDGRLVLKRLIEVTGGDLRRAVGLLQSAHQLGRPLRAEDADELAGVIPGQFVDEALRLAGDPKTTIQVLLDWVNAKVIRAGYPAMQFIYQVS